MRSTDNKILVTKSPKPPIINIRINRGMHGFTIIELLLATVVFSLVMLGALVGFLQTGRVFYKGVSVTQTQAVAKQILDDISTSISDTSASRILLNQTGGSYNYICIGNVRYTYNADHIVDLSQPHGYAALTPGGNFGLLRDNVTGCAAPCTSGCGSAGFDQTKPVELLSDRMRISSASSLTSSGNLFTINVTVAYGDVPSLNRNPPVCVGGSQEQQFCAVSSLSTSVSTSF